MPDFDPVSKNRAKPLCLKLRITTLIVTHNVTSYKMHNESKLTGGEPTARKCRRRAVRLSEWLGSMPTHWGRPLALRRTTADSAATTQRQISQNAAFAKAAKTIPPGGDGPVRKGPPSTNHQTATPGWTKSLRGSRTTDGMTWPEMSKARADVLAKKSAPVKNRKCRRVMRRSMLPNEPS